MFKRILLATDGSPALERQILFAEHLARVEPAEIIVLHAYTPPEQYSGYSGNDELLAHVRTVAQSVVDEAAGELRDDGVDARAELRAGPAAEAIMAAVADHAIDLIVLGKSRSSSLAELLGSVSAQVLRQARCPVLQIP